MAKTCHSWMSESEKLHFISLYNFLVIYFSVLISKIIIGFLSDNPWVLVFPTPVTQTL
jgi:hypothetical protein